MQVFFLRYLVLSVTVLAVVVTTPLAGSQVDRLAAQIRNDEAEDQVRYVWQSPESVIGDDGQWITDEIPRVFDGPLRGRFETHIREIRVKGSTADGPCYSLVIKDHAIPPGRAAARMHGDLRDIAASAEFAVRGEVVDTRGGFLYGRPGVMLSVRPTGWPKRPPTGLLPELIHVFYPVGSFEFGPTRFCVESATWPASPPVGAQVLFFPQAVAAIAADPPIYAASPLGVDIVLSVNGALQGPRHLAEVDEIRSSRSLAQISRRIRRLLRD